MSPIRSLVFYNFFVCHLALKILFDDRKFHKGLQVIRIMEENNISPDVYCYTQIFGIFAKTKSFKRGAEAFQKIALEKNVLIDVVLARQMLELFFHLERVKEFLHKDEIKSIKKNVIFYSELVRLCIPKGQIQIACQAYNSMISEKILPDAVFCNYFAKVLKNYGNVEIAQYYFSEFSKLKIKFDKSFYISIMGDAFAKEGDNDVILKHLEKFKNASMFVSLIKSLTLQNKLEDLRNYLSKYSYFLNNKKVLENIFDFLIENSQFELLDFIYETYVEKSKLMKDNDDKKKCHVDVEGMEISLGIACLRSKCKQIRPGNKVFVHVGKNKRLKYELLKFDEILGKQISINKESKKFIAMYKLHHKEHILQKDYDNQRAKIPGQLHSKILGIIDEFQEEEI